nr:hypothetical protein [Tanacetum cinerariifolium]
MVLCSIWNCSASVLATSEGSDELFALAGYFPFAVEVSLGAAVTVVIGVGIAVGGVMEVSESLFFLLALAFGLGAASPVA